MRVLIGCEFSGVVRDQFIRLGHDAVSCDVLPTRAKGPHIQDDVLAVINDGWDLAIFHPPCTYLANSGNKHLYIEPERPNKAALASIFFKELLNSPIPRVCVENPIMRAPEHNAGRRADQVIQPWMFGHMEKKATCLWLRGLPKLMPISDLKEATEALPLHLQQKSFYMTPSADRGLLRSITYHGIAFAMAKQWGSL